MPTIPIEDPADPRLEPYRDIRERDLTRRGGFIAEGSVVLDQLLAARDFRVSSLLVLPERLNGLAARLANLPGDVPVFVAPRPVFDAVAGFPVHRGVMGFGERIAAPGDDAARLRSLRAENRDVVVAAGISNHDNMGAIFRNAAAFGAGAVILDERCCDPLYRKAIRVSVGTVLTVPFCRRGTADAIWAELEAIGFEPLALSPAGTRELSQLGVSERPRALFLGTEGEGLGEGFLAPRSTLRIAMAPGLDSLNVATSAAIVLHHLLALRTRR